MLWNALSPVVTTVEFGEACTSLPKTADAAAATLMPPNTTERLQARGYSQQEMDEIVVCNEIFLSGNMPYLLIATRARLSLEEDDWVAKTGTPCDCHPPVHPRPLLIETRHATRDIGDVYADIQHKLRLPFVNTDYRAFARWTSYFKTAWADLRPQIGKQLYEAKVLEIHDASIALARALPNPSGLTFDELRDAVRHEHGDVVETVRLFQWLLPGLALNVALFRNQLLSSCCVVMLFSVLQRTCLAMRKTDGTASCSAAPKMATLANRNAYSEPSTLPTTTLALRSRIILVGTNFGDDTTPWPRPDQGDHI